LPRQLTPSDTYIVYMYIPTYMYIIYKCAWGSGWLNELGRWI